MDKQQAIVTVRSLLEREGNKSFSDIQEYVFSECWENTPYKKIAQKSGYEYNYVKRIGSQVWALLSQCLDKKVSKNNFHATLHQYLIETENRQTSVSSENHDDVTSSIELIRDRLENQSDQLEQIQDWEEVIDTASFLGRETEIDLLQNWIVSDRVRLITILGMGGIGKTSLTAKLAQSISSEFTQVIWRSLRHAPPCNEFLEQLILTISQQQANNPELSISNKISCLLKYLRSQRCLLILDNAESILESQKQLGKYQSGYEGYGELLRRIAEEVHQSCVIITSREQLGGIASKVKATGVVRSLSLQDLRKYTIYSVLSQTKTQSRHKW